MPPEVLLVGAGPGAADLMTVRALRAVQGAQALLYDALVEPEVLDLAPARCLKIRTGKRAGRASMKQETINRLMLRLARRGLKVVRLKGGDPSIFGRVGEERAFLETHGVAVQVIPGVTAASAAAAQFGLPLTHRGAARRVLFLTARVIDGRIAEDWSACADPETTVCVYMGRDSAAAVAAELLRLGRSGETPACLIENAGGGAARRIDTPLARLGETAAAQALDGPCLMIIGEVAAVRGTEAAGRVAI